MTVIQIDNVSKSYRLGAIGGGTLREDVARWWARFRGRPDPFLKINEHQRSEVGGQRSEVSSQRSEVSGQRSEVRGPSTDAPPHRRTDVPTYRRTAPPPSDLFWALRNINLEVKEGEILGIIGRNGAGKSTLLKILSRVTGPTEGEIRVRGRIASLLEVGTGFHPELTGRENVLLNGAILGMTKPEIRRKFDEIIDFSGVEQFIDTPVKRYSSGMYVRLAFAVAAHLEPEILIVDEVLAVGDADFQKKCLGKMQDVSHSGRTVLIVSHNMGMITALCRRAVLLEAGQLTGNGGASQVVMQYLGRGSEKPSVIHFSRNGRTIGDDLATLLRAWIEDANGELIHEVDIREPFRVKMVYEIHVESPIPPYANIHVFDQRGEYVFVTASRDYVQGECSPGVYEAECCIPGNLLNDGCYFLGLAATFTHKGLHVSFWEKDALRISVMDPVLETTDSLRLGYVGPMPGPVRPQLEWKIEKVRCS